MFATAFYRRKRVSRAWKLRFNDPNEVFGHSQRYRDYSQQLTITRALAYSIAELDQWLTRRKRGSRCRPRGHEDDPQCSIRRVTTSKPNHLRGWAVPLEEYDKIRILGQHNGTCSTGTTEDRLVFCLTKTKPPHSDGVHGQRLAHPLGHRRRDLRVNPELHACVSPGYAAMVR